MDFGPLDQHIYTWASGTLDSHTICSCWWPIGLAERNRWRTTEAELPVRLQARPPWKAAEAHGSFAVESPFSNPKARGKTGVDGKTQPRLTSGRDGSEREIEAAPLSRVEEQRARFREEEGE